jgi:hypothetical protein
MSLLRADHIQTVPARADTRFIGGMATVDNVNVTARMARRDVRPSGSRAYPPRVGFDLRHKEGLVNYRHFMEAAGDLVASYGGSMSGEHGDGQQRAELLYKQYGPRLLEAMRKYKLNWDPEWKMNPGRVIDPDRFDENLELGTDYKRRPVRRQLHNNRSCG